jgi:hypothetical protein
LVFCAAKIAFSRKNDLGSRNPNPNFRKISQLRMVYIETILPKRGLGHSFTGGLRFLFIAALHSRHIPDPLQTSIALCCMAWVARPR